METNTNLRISIPKPCHEDWNKFTPDEKGAFCKVCSKSVYDFTKKTVEEISVILVDEITAGKKVCGRFTEDQLTQNDQLPDSLNPFALNFARLKKFALALFLVFGGYLFGTTKSFSQKLGKVAYIPRLEPLKGEVSVPYVEPKIETAVSIGDTIITAAPKEPKCTIRKGDVKTELQIKSQIMGGIKAIQIEEPMITGDVSIMPMDDSIDEEVVVFISPILEDTAKGESSSLEVEIMGMIAMPSHFDIPILADSINVDSLEQESLQSLAVIESTYVEVKAPSENKIVIPESNGIEFECYPNPSVGLINIRYTAEQNSIVSLQIFDLNGNLIKTLLSSQRLYMADYSSQYDISDLSDGLYFCELTVGTLKSTQRIILAR